ncbi:MAG TPA: hypothetical protein VFL77_04980 [Solirubrobacterales bacterium]|nr:hypothetical protein [Solirubrobacterales bacterium]
MAKAPAGFARDLLKAEGIMAGVGRNAPERERHSIELLQRLVDVGEARNQTVAVWAQGDTALDKEVCSDRKAQLGHFTGVWRQVVHRFGEGPDTRESIRQGQGDNSNLSPYRTFIAVENRRRAIRGID